MGDNTGQQEQMQDARRLLRERMSEQHIEACLDDKAREFFFVDFATKPTWNAHQLFDEFERTFGNAEYPKYKRILQIHDREATSLGNVVAFHTAVVQYLGKSNRQSAISGALMQSGLGGGLPDGCVVPSLCMLDRERSWTLPTGQPNKFETVPVVDYLMRTVTEAMLAQALTACGSADGGKVANELLNKSIGAKPKKKEVRVTSVLAHAVVDTFNAGNPGRLVEVKTTFSWNPSGGQGKGRKTSAIPVEAGNVLPTAAQAKNHPDS